MVISLSFLFLAIMSSNPIIALLANEKLNGDNYVKWKSNINIVLICENQKFVLTEECPQSPTPLPLVVYERNMISGRRRTIRLVVTCWLA